MNDLIERLRKAADDVMSHQWSGDKERMYALQDLCFAEKAAADALEAQAKRIEELEAERDAWKAEAASSDYTTLRKGIRLWLDGDTRSSASELLECSDRAIAALEADAERYRWLRDNIKERPMNQRAYASEIVPDTRLRYELPVLVSWADYCGQITLDDAVDKARAVLAAAQEPTA